MPLIYARSTLVIVWLGCPTPSLEKATRFINKLTFHPLLIELVDLFEVDMPNLKAVNNTITTAPRSIWRALWKEFVRIGYSIFLHYYFLFVWLIRLAVDVLKTSRNNILPKNHIITTLDLFKLMRNSTTTMNE